MSNTFNVYVSRPAWLAVARWAPSTSYSSGSYVRNGDPSNFWPSMDFWCGAGAQQITFNFGATSFAATPPSGFSGWDATCTLDPAVTGANLTLSGGNLTVAVGTGVGAWQLSRGTVSKSSGKLYYEAAITTRTGSTVQGYGVQNNGNTSVSNSIGFAAGSAGYGDAGAADVNGVNAGGWQGAGAGTTVCLAFDLTNSLMWARTITPGTVVYAAVGLWCGFSPAQQVTANFGGSAFNMTAPSGFSAWGASDTFDAVNIGSGLTLSGGNLTVTSGTGSSTGPMARSAGSHSSGKWYFEFLLNTVTGATSQAYGVANGSQPLGNYPGTGSPSTDGASYSNSSGTTYNISGMPGTWQGGGSSGNFVGIAVDLDAGLMWARTSANGNWNGSGTANPATGVGGISIAGVDGITPWNNNTSANPATGVGGYDLTAITKLTAGNERVFKSGGLTSGSSEPNWNLGNNATTSDNGGTWTQVAGQEGEQAAANWKAPLGSLAFSFSGLSAGTGVVVFASSDHAESWTTDPGYSPGNVQGLFSVNRGVGSSIPPAAADYAPGAQITTTGTTPLTIKCGSWYGFTFTAGSGGSGTAGFTFGSSTGGSVYLESCAVQMVSTGSASVIFIGGNGSFPGAVEWVNTTVKFGSTGHVIQVGADDFTWRDTPSAIDTGGQIPASLMQSTPAGWGDGYKLFKGLDLSALNTRLLPNNGNMLKLWDLVDCKLNAALTPLNGFAPTPMGGMRLTNCDVAGGTNYELAWNMQGGQIYQISGAARSGGASDGVTRYAHELNVTSYGRLPSPWYSYRYGTTGVSKTITMYAIAFGTHLPAIPDTLTAYMEIEALDDASGSPLSGLHTTRPSLAWGASSGGGTANSSDTSDWTVGSTVTTRTNSQVLTAGQFVKVPSAPAGMLFQATGSGTTASSVPGAYATAVDGQLISDGGLNLQAGYRLKIQTTVTFRMKGSFRARLVADNSNEYVVFGYTLIVDPLPVVS